MALQSRSGPDLSPAELYELLRLRAEIFVVEQNCPYQDLDGLDLHAQTVHLWLTDPHHRVISCVRVLPERAGRRKIGRVVTATEERGRGHASRLLTAALALDPTMTWELHAQSVVADLYRRFGFRTAGAEFLEDGIAHLPMVRPPT